MADFNRNTAGGSLQARFRSLSRRLYPTNLRDMLLWADELYKHNGIYSSGMSKSIGYFVTEMSIFKNNNHLTGSEFKNYEDEIDRIYTYKEKARYVGEDLGFFGNAFASLHKPFSRHIVCPDCGGQWPLKHLHSYVKYDRGSFRGACPNSNCRYSGEMKVKDRSVDIRKFHPHMIRWSPECVSIEKHPLSGRTIYRVDPSKDIMLSEAHAAKSDLFLEDTPMPFIKALDNNMEIELHDEQIVHLKEEGCAMLAPYLRGWGMPRFMKEFEEALLCIFLDKMNEANIVSNLLPLRLLTPAPVTGSSNGGLDAAALMQGAGLSNLSGEITNILQEYQRNPTGWHKLGTPIQYQQLGGDAKQLAPVELMEYHQNKLMTSMGIPAEFWQARNNAGPVQEFAMFEKSFANIGVQMDTFIDWLCRKHGELSSWGSVSAKFRRISMSKEATVTDMIYNLHSIGKVSDDTLYELLDLDARQERLKKRQEDMDVEEETREYQKQLEERDMNIQAVTPTPPAQLLAEQKAMAEQGAEGGGGPQGPPPGASMGGAPGGGGSPEMGGGSISDMYAQAEQYASEIYPLPNRNSLLRQLKKDDATMHALVKQFISDIDSKASSEGKAMAKQQM